MTSFLWDSVWLPIVSKRPLQTIIKDLESVCNCEAVTFVWKYRGRESRPAFKCYAFINTDSFDSYILMALVTHTQY